MTFDPPFRFESLAGIEIEPEKYRTRAVGCTCEWAVCRCPVDYIVYYAQRHSGQWIVERVSDGAEVARGTLEEMMALVEGPGARFANGRRAHHSEDYLRFRPSFLDDFFGDGHS